MSLTTCLKKAGDAIHADDKAAVLDRARALRAEGKTPTEAAKQAVDTQIAKVRAMLQGADPAAAAPPSSPASLFDGFKATMAKLYDGELSIDDYRAAYRAVRDGKATLVAELNKLTKDELIRTFGIMRDGKKDELVGIAYDSMVDRFALGKSYGPNSYGMTRGGYENYLRLKAEALDALVEGQTADDLAAFAKEVAARREEAAQQRAARAKAIADPKTIPEFRAYLEHHMREGKTNREARMSLTPEQRALMDSLWAKETRSRRKDKQDEQRTAVRVAGQTVDGQIIATKHTKKGHDLFVVRLAERVSREDYETLNTGAKKIGGYYSSYRGGGAIPGFQFTTREQADAFVKLAGGDASQAKEAAQERRDAFADDRSQTAVQRLTEMADALQERAEESLGRERKANTERRARMAASAEADARHQQALARTMRNIAGAIEAGKAEFLDRVRQKVQVELLSRLAHNARDAQLHAKYPSYSDYERHKGSAPDAETADFAEFPSYTAYRSDLASLGRQLLEVDGTKLLGQRLMKVADDVSDAYLAFAKEPGNLFKLSAFSVRHGDAVRTAIFPDKATAERSLSRSGLAGQGIVFQEKRGVNRIILSPSEAIKRGIWKGDGDKRITLTEDFGAELVEKMGRANRRGARVSVPWQFETAHERLKALARMGIETPAEMRAALREFIGLREQPAEADRVKQLERAMVGKKNDGFDFFPTPEGVADEMVNVAGIEPGMRVLEPSAGMGHIAERIREAGVEPDVGEIASDRRELLEAKGFNLVARDFLDLKEGDYDRIVMNPPFSDGRDIAHVRHAYELLKPGGRLVAIMGEGAFSQSFKRAEEFRDWLESVGGTEEKLPEGTFLDPSLPVNTGANARMVVVDKGDVPALSRAAPEHGRLGRSGSTGLTITGVQRAVDELTKGWANAPTIIVAQDMRDPLIPLSVRRHDEHQRSLGATGDVRGFIHGGRVYLLADELPTHAAVAEVIFHEALGHFGLRGVFDKGLDDVLRQMAAAMPDRVAKKAKVYGLDMSNERQRLLAAEEVLAEIASERPQSTWVQRAIAAIKQWLRDNMPGLADLKLTDADVIALFIEPARRFVEQGAPARAARGLAAPAFSRSTQARRQGLPGDIAEIHTARDTDALKAHRDYAAAKAGDMDAAARLVRDLVRPADIEAARSLGEGVMWAYPHALEASGHNMIPAMMAARYAAETGGTVAEPLIQVNRAFHTGADAMQRLIARPLFDGPVEAGRRYVLVDDVSTMGGTLAELANHIQDGGGQVVGVVTLANAGRAPTMPALKQQLREIERRYGQALRDDFQIEPAALTRDEARYVLGFRDADALRTRAAAAKRDRGERLRAKGLQEDLSGDAPAFSRAPEPFQDLSRVGSRMMRMGYQQQPVPRVQAARKLAALIKRLDDGKITPVYFETAVRSLAATMDTVVTTKAANRLMSDRERGADMIREKLIAARRRGDIEDEAVEFGLWAIDQNPAIADGLGISLRTPPEGKEGVAGDYNPLSQVMRLFKGAENRGVAVHEIMHHTERMMPPDVQEAISKAWARAFGDAVKRATAAQRSALIKMAEAIAGDREAANDVSKAFSDGVLEYDQHYQLVNASEYWAVNATRILESRHAADSWVAKAKQWLREMMQKVKSLLRLPSDAPVLAGLRAVLEGDGSQQSKNMLSQATAASSFQDRSRAPATDSEAFRRWFGNSKVVDADGKPLVVYHGTHRDFSAFDAKAPSSHIPLPGFYFSPDPEIAGMFAENGAKMAENRAGRPYAPVGANVMPAYLSLQNPLDVDASEGAMKGFVGEKVIKEIILEAQRKGHDGVILRGWQDGSGPVQYIAFRPEQIKSATGNRGTFDPADPDIRFSRGPQKPLDGVSTLPDPPPPPRQPPLVDGGKGNPESVWTMPKGTGLDNAIYKFQDKNVDLKRSIDAIRAESRAINDRFDAYLQEELYHGRAASRVEDFAENELRPLIAEMKLRQVTTERLSKYLHARHAEEANELIAERGGLADGGSGMTTADARAFLAGLDPAERKRLDAVATKVDAMIAKTREAIVDYGLEARDVVDGWAEMFEHYVPLQREEHDGEGMGIGQGFSIRGKEAKHRTGSTAAVSDILANVALQREKAIVRGEKNRVAVAMVGLALTNPNPDVWSVEKPPTEQVLNQTTQQIETRIVPGWRDDPNVLTAKIKDGKGNVVERAVVFNVADARATVNDRQGRKVARMAAALKNLDAEKLEGWIAASAKVTRYFASINTQYNPVFGFTNLVRDLQAAAINLSGTPIDGRRAEVMAQAMKFLGEAARAGFRMDGIKDQALWKELQAEGGTTGFRDLYRTTEDRANAIKRELDPHYWMQERYGRVLTAGGALSGPAKVAQNTTGWLFDWLSDFNESLENVTRLAAYKVALDHGMSRQRAASLAKNLTVNFNRGGAQKPLMGAMYAFFNAAMQGTARIAQTMFDMKGGDIKTLHLTRAGKAIIGGGVLLGVLQALALAAAGFEDDDIPEFVKERNLILPLPGTEKKYLMLPMPLGYHVLPNFGRRAAELALNKGKGAGKKAAEMFGTMLDAFNPLGGSGTVAQILSPTALDPMVALLENKDWTGRPIAKRDWNAVEPGFKNAREAASDPARWIARGVNAMSGGTEFVRGKVSPTPDQIDYLIGQATGGVGREISKAMTMATSARTGETLPTHKIPLVGRFYGDAGQAHNQASRFYEALTRMREHKATIDGLAKEGRRDDLQAYLKANPEARMAGAAELAGKKISELRASRRLLIEKGQRARVKEIEAKLNDAMTAFNKKVDEAQTSEATSSSSDQTRPAARATQELATTN